ncbi:M56 family metallopeptidase [Flavobacterium sp. ACN6]|uniref:M56 family metallopeptidase n=1 Tax=Flavobacterium sp. ACN6 TaxID=1920426 RepID=UPI000BB38CCB|nr:M56 family metallopeptidase [Flavobacterium sp. ACN6]PBJ13090.1 BlaR1 peptidase M56 [Flavobacterium sp. ACN6]
MITYLLKSGVLLVVFYAVYKMLLENEKMFRFNRIYLLGSIVFSLIIPLQLFSIGSFLSTKTQMIELDEIMIITNKTVLDKVNYTEILTYFLSVIYIVITAILIVRLIRNIYSFTIRKKRSKIEFINGQKIVLTKESVLPHSFWNTIFINQEDFNNGKIQPELIAHEKAHLQQRHTLDILFVEVLQIVFWFNPLFVLFEKEIKLNHEFLADEAVNKQFGEIKNYQNLLLDFASHKSTVSLASNINYLITKKRLLMMTKRESPIKIALKVFSVGMLYVLLLFVFSTETVAQEVIKNDDFKKLTEVSVKPDYPGGIVEFYKFVGQNYKLPAEVSKQKLNGKVYLQFMIEEDGSLTNIEILRDKLGYGAGEEAVRVLKLSPKWIPASDQGKPVRVMYSLPITIQADK